MTLFLQRFDEIIATLFSRKKLFSCIQLNGLRYEIMLYLIYIKIYYFLQSLLKYIFTKI